VGIGIHNKNTRRETTMNNKETNEILNDDDAMQAIAEGLQDLETGQLIDFDRNN